MVALLLCVLLTSFGCASSKGGGSAKKQKKPKRTVLITMADDERAGQEGSRSVEAEMGTLDDPKLTAYVSDMGKKLLRGLPRRDFAYHFAIVDQMEPNAFALPGGYIYVSRGLLALINNEDELACVLGHEIVHAARRHSAQQQAVQAYQSPLSMGRSRAKTLAAYGRDMEREADELGQKLCAAAGFDPMAMSTFLRKLDQRERLLIGVQRAPTFFDTHPGSGERAAANSMRAGELRWTRDPTLGDTRAGHLNKIDGMAIGDRPEAGVFIGDRFLHPVLDFEMRFPRGWRVQNSASAVGAMAPRGEAVVYLSADLPEGDLVEIADKFALDSEQDFGLKVTEKKRVQLGDLDAVRYGFSGGGGGRGITARVTFFPYAGSTWRIVGVAPKAAANRYMGQILLTTRSFSPLKPAHRAEIQTNHLRVVLARAGEDLVALGDRTENAWPPGTTAIINGQLGNEVYAGGELVKILRSERFGDR